MNKKEFDYITQIDAGNLYELLIPKKDYGIIIFNLYKQLENKNNEIFTENDIMQLIIKIRGYKKKEQREYVKDIIRELNEFFLKETEKKYRLTEYAKNFCETIINKLKNDFEPSEIEKRLLFLKNTISDYKSFDEWFNLIFTKNLTGIIESQLESLERQVINAIKRFRAGVNDDNIKGDLLVKNILHSIEKINIQTKKLKGSLKYAEQIKSIINRKDPNIETNPEQSLQKQQYVIVFMNTLLSDFERVSKRIERVIPKLRQFYGNMTRLEFEKNTNKLLNFMLKETTIIGYKPNWKLRFPTISDVCLEKNIMYLPHKIYFVDNKKDLGDFRGNNQKMYEPKTNKDEKEKQKKVAVENLEKRSKLFDFINEIEKVLEYEKSVNYKKHFEQIIKETNDINIAVKTVSILMKKYSKNKNYKLTINEPLKRISENTILWDLKIEKLN